MAFLFGVRIPQQTRWFDPKHLPAVRRARCTAAHLLSQPENAQGHEGGFAAGVLPYPAPSSCTQKDAAAKSPEVSTTSGLFCAQFLKSEKKISKRVLAKSMDLNLYPRHFEPLFREFFRKAALFYSRQNVEFKQVVLLVLLNRHSECIRHDVGTDKARNIQEDSI